MAALAVLLKNRPDIFKITCEGVCFDFIFCSNYALWQNQGKECQSYSEEWFHVQFGFYQKIMWHVKNLLEGLTPPILAIKNQFCK
jgi:hypothetical protein